MARNTRADESAPEEIERELEQTRRQIARTIDAIQSRMTPGQVFQEFYDLARGGPTDYVRNLGLAARNNPVPVALVGVGLAWLATSGGRTPSYLRGAREPDYNADPSDGSSALSAAGAAARTGMQSAADYAAAAGRTTADITSQAGDSIGEAASGIGARVGDMAAGTSDRVRQMADDVRNLAAEWSEGAAEAGEAARERAHQARAKIQEQALHLRESASHLWRDQPLIVGALGLAIGAVLGAVLPSTRRENALMGEARDQLVDQATRMSEHALDEASAVVSEVADAATGAATGDAGEKDSLEGAELADSSDPDSGGKSTVTPRTGSAR